MTREEAREWFKNALWNNDFFPETEDAFKVAIEALSADTVSRSQYQGLLNAIEKVYVEVVRCKDCKHAEHREQMPNQIYCHRDKLSLHSYLHDDDDFCKYGERREP